MLDSAKDQPTDQSKRLKDENTEMSLISPSDKVGCCSLTNTLLSSVCVTQVDCTGLQYLNQC